MERLGQIKLENTISVQMSCTVDEKIVANNFGIIMDCLKALSDKQSSFDKELKDLNSLRQQVKDLNEKSDRNLANNGSNNNNTSKNDSNNRGNNNEKSITGDESNKNKSESNEIKKEESVNQKNDQKNNTPENNIKSNEKQITGNYNPADFDRLSTDLHGLKERVTKNEGNINENIRDINVIQKDIKQIKDLLNSIGKKTETTDKKQKSDVHQKTGPTFDISSIKDIHNEIIKKQEFIDKINDEMEKMKERISQNEKDISELKQLSKETKNNEKNGNNGNNIANNNGGNSNNNGGNNNNDNQINDLKEKLNILSNKLTNNILDTNQNTGGIKNLNTENSKRKGQTESNKKEIDNLKNQLNRLIQQLDQSNTKRQTEMRNMKNDIKNKKNQKGQKNQKNQNTGINSDKKMHSNTSIEEENNNKLGIDKSPYNQKKFYSSNNSNFGESIRELQERVRYLEKMISGSKHLIQEDKNNNNPEKLPMIRRPIVSQKQREKDSQNKTHFSTSKRDIGELKAEIQAWVKNYFESGKEKGDLGNLELQIQQLRNMLNKKADYEGMKKGLTFLENKINQLYLFLTEPDTEDAMIVRKGFNCLSCSKGVQKLRGRLGPNINWNNMTTTNYSPPRVGYSKPMGEGSIDRDD